MSKVFLLGANKEIDRAKQVVELNQIIQMEGYSYDRYVVYEIRKNDWGIAYKLINLRTKEFQTADIIRPLNEKFGIGYYYDSENPEFMDSFEVTMLLQQAQQQKKAEEAEAEQEDRQHHLRTVGDGDVERRADVRQRRQHHVHRQRIERHDRGDHAPTRRRQ